MDSMSRWFVALMLVLAPASAAADSQFAVQEALLRAKPAVALVVSEVTTAVTLRCGATETVVTPPPFRETGTGWFAAPSGWLITNGHVVSPAHRPPDWLLKQQADKVTRAGCRVVKTSPEPSISVMLSNGFRLPA